MDPAESSATAKQRCCVGLLFYSQAMQNKGQTPTCFGIKQKQDLTVDLHDRTQLHPDTSSDFKFYCVGHSVYEEARAGAAGASAQGKPGVHLPYCEGFEVLVTGQLNPEPPGTPSTSRGAAAWPSGQPVARGASASTSAGDDDSAPRTLEELLQRLSNVDGSGNTFADRFVRAARRNANSMRSMINLMYSSTVKPIVDKLAKDDDRF